MIIRIKIRPAVCTTFFLIIFCFRDVGFQVAQGQSPEPIYQIIQLDSITIQASKNGLNIEDFIDLVIKDKSFYEAFQNLRFASYSFQNQITIRKRKPGDNAHYESLAHQVYLDSCRSMQEENKIIENDFFDKKGEYNYYTAKLYDRLFFTHGTICRGASNNTSASAEAPQGMEKHVLELKKLLFTPGQKANVPLIGNKTAIFEKEMLPYFDYKISADTLRNQLCYVFSIQPKSEFQHQNTGKTVIKNLQTWFAQGSFQILKRKYSLEARTLFYSFDVSMDIDVMQVNHKYYPKAIQYSGTWKLASKRKEQADFNILFSNFKS